LEENFTKNKKEKIRKNKRLGKKKARKNKEKTKKKARKNKENEEWQQRTTNEIQHHLTQSTGHGPKDRDWFPQQGMAHVVFHTVDVGQCFAMYHVFLGKSKGVVH